MSSFTLATCALKSVMHCSARSRIDETSFCALTSVASSGGVLPQASVIDDSALMRVPASVDHVSGSLSISSGILAAPSPGGSNRVSR